MSLAAQPSIDQLKELALPAPPAAYWPQTWGWAVLLGLLLVLAGAVIAVRRIRWQRDRYRREALAELAALEHQIAQPRAHAAALRALPELIKRVALSMNASEPVAPLSGPQWQAFLQKHAPTSLPDDLAARLAGLAYQPDAQLMHIPDAEVQGLLKVCTHWVEAHHVGV